MGSKRKMKKITTAEMEILIADYFNYNSNIKLIVPNVYWGQKFMHECDILMMTAAGYLTEIEIKVSLSDLKKDKEKEHGHNSIEIKYLYFAIPEYLEKHVEHIPDRAGIIVIREDHGVVSTSNIVTKLRPAIINKGCKPLSDKYQLAKLGAVRIWHLKRKIFDLKEELKKARDC